MLRGKNIVITGASSGIGELMAVKAAQHGANLVLIARRQDELERIQAEVLRFGRECHIVKLDVRDLAGIEATFSAIRENIGDVDVLINNAGFGYFQEVADIDLEQMKAMFEVNVFGLIACTKAVVPGMMARRSGHIINIASIAGKIATPKSSVYSASKHAVLGFTNALRIELSEYNVHVTAVNPGPIRTNFFTIADASGSYEKNVSRYMLDPDFVANKVIQAIGSPKREINLPGWMGLGGTIYQVIPGLVERFAGKAMFKK